MKKPTTKQQLQSYIADLEIQLAALRNEMTHINFTVSRHVKMQPGSPTSKYVAHLLNRLAALSPECIECGHKTDRVMLQSTCLHCHFTATHES